MRHIISLLRPRLTSLFLSFAVIVCFAGAVASRKAIAAGQSSGVTAPVIFMTASSTPTPAPCSSKIAFTSSRDGNDEIYGMNADGSNQTRLTNNPSQDNTPSFNGDGSKIAFASARGGLYWEVYVMNADGSNQTLLTNHANAIYGLSFGG